MLRNFTIRLAFRSPLFQSIKPSFSSHTPSTVHRSYVSDTIAMPPRRSARAAAAPKYDETSDNDRSDDLDNIVKTPSPKKRAPSAAAKAKADTKENVKVKTSAAKTIADATEVKAEVKVTKKGAAKAKKVIEDEFNGEDAQVEESVKQELEVTTTAKVKVKVGRGKKAETVEVEPHELEVVKKGKASAKRKVKTEDAAAEEEDKVEKKVVKKRKTKEEKEAELIPLAPRTDVSTLKRKMFIGAHISGAGGVQNAVTNAVYIGANAFAVFLKSQRKWASPPMADEARDGFKENCEKEGFEAGKVVLPHGSYLVNLAQEEDEKAKQAYDCFLDDLKRCDSLGIKLFNFHPGNTGPHPRAEAIGRIAAQLNKAHKETESVITVLENMAGQGNVIGSTWEDLRDIIALVEDKSRVGVCIDTCHAFAAGYDLRSTDAFAKTMDSFNEIVGAKYLKALHLNDSKTPLGSNRDLHYNIGTGFLGLRAFYNVVNYPGFEGLPMVLETPIDRKGEDGKMIEDKKVWADEIKLLEKMVGCDFEAQEWRDEEARLQEVGKSEREKFEKQVEKKKVKDQEKGQKSIKDMFGKGKKKKGGKKAKVEEVETESEGEQEHKCSHD